MVTIKRSGLGGWVIEVPVPNRTAPARLFAASEEDAQIFAKYLNEKLTSGTLFPRNDA